MPIDTSSLEQLLANSQLPALPQSAIRLLQLSQNPDNGPTEFAVPIESDPGLVGQVLKFVNSSYFGFAREIASVKLALSLVGVRTIQNFALWSAVFSVVPNPKCGSLDIKVLWQDSLRRGLFSRAMGRRLKLKDAEDLFTAALLQDMAIPVLAKEMPDKYVALLQESNGDGCRLIELEENRFGWNHAQAAGKMALQWNLPENITTLIASHSVLSFSPTTMLPSIVALSAILPGGGGELWAHRETFEAGFEAICQQQFSIASVFEEVDLGYNDIAPLMKLSGNIKPLATIWSSVEPAVN